MIDLIKNIPFKIVVCCMFILTVGSCATVSRVPETGYAEIDQDKAWDYFITFKDGTKHAAKRISFTDTTLTIYESRHLKYEGYTDIESDELPYTINLSDIESVRKKTTSLSLSVIAGIVVIFAVGIAVYATALSGLGGT